MHSIIIVALAVASITFAQTGPPCTVPGTACAAGFGFCSPDLFCDTSNDCYHYCGVDNICGGKSRAVWEPSATLLLQRSLVWTPTVCNNPADDAQGDPTGACIAAVGPAVGPPCTTAGLNCYNSCGTDGICGGVGAKCDTTAPFVSGQVTATFVCNTPTTTCTNPADAKGDPIGVCNLALGPSAGARSRRRDHESKSPKWA
ncbi:hypothetical protein RQP46_007204 [Phenoliferia psychrophenolica]